MFDLSDVWGTNDPAKVFGGGPDDQDVMPCSEAGDYGPGNPWDAPGMSPADFMPGLCF